MIADSFFAIGSTHRVCQDYATHWHRDHLALAIVCDGCSDSPKTDVGARLLAETFSTCVRSQIPAPRNFLKDSLTLFGANMRNIVRLLGMHTRWFDATLLAAIANEETQTISLFIWGDGHLRIEHTDGRVTTLDVDFNENQNAPYYPSYTIFRPEGRRDYESAYGPLKPNRVWTSEVIPPPTWDEEFPRFEIPMAGVHSVNLYSDGASSFLKGPELTHVPSTEVTAQLQDYKLIGEGVLGRRAHKCQKLWRKEQIQHADDLGVATLVFPEESPQPNPTEQR